MTDDQPLHCAFMPLLDSLLLLVAREQGFAAREGVQLVLHRETSWANIRDRLAVGQIQAAHLLAPMPLACNLGLTPLGGNLIAPMALGLGGNAVTLSRSLWAEMQMPTIRTVIDPTSGAAALSAVIRQRARQGDPALRLGVVHQHSVHNYELRYWLASCGIDPRTDLDIRIVAPPLMVDALQSNQIDGFCVGEPYNTIAVQQDVGRILTVKSAIWRSSPEKVLGVSTDWAREHPETLAALIRALYRAAQWCDQIIAEGRQQVLADLLAAPTCLDLPAHCLLPALAGQLPAGGDAIIEQPDFFLPFARAATFPWISHAMWIYSQMVRWGDVNHDDQNAAVVAASFRPDIYRRSLEPAGWPVPGANSKVEGALVDQTVVGASQGTLELGPDGFFDGRIFDPAQLDGYLASLD